MFCLYFSAVCIIILIVGVTAGVYDRKFRRKFLAKYEAYIRPSLGYYTKKKTGPTPKLETQYSIEEEGGFFPSLLFLYSSVGQMVVVVICLLVMLGTRRRNISKTL